MTVLYWDIFFIKSAKVHVQWRPTAGSNTELEIPATVKVVIKEISSFICPGIQKLVTRFFWIQECI